MRGRNPTTHERAVFWKFLGAALSGDPPQHVHICTAKGCFGLVTLATKPDVTPEMVTTAMLDTLDSIRTVLKGNNLTAERVMLLYTTAVWTKDQVEAVIGRPISDRDAQTVIEAASERLTAYKNSVPGILGLDSPDAGTLAFMLVSMARDETDSVCSIMQRLTTVVRVGGSVLQEDGPPRCVATTFISDAMHQRLRSVFA